MNYVKTSNKLIGEIENNDLYASDEGILGDGFGINGGGNRGEVFDDNFQNLRGVEIDFGPSKKDNEIENKDSVAA